ncbi:HEPN domain-containing protein [Moritella dasanensis]|uniref:ApeA N-terminal domain 1-containing protein n=1 Tax=Moritella dasanensis TaxID=428031 RepID=UPI0002E1358B|nr:HEPN domain-containing protein [Moritella dasanensis]
MISDWNEKNIGTFSINGKDYLGELKLSGSNSLLTVWGEDRATSVLGHNLPDQIHGSFNDLKKVTLLDLFNFGGGHNSKQRSDGNYDYRYFSEICPSYVILGDRYIAKEEQSFEAIEFFITHSSTLFFDSQTFHDVIHTNKEMVERLITEDHSKSEELYENSFPRRSIKVGDYPIVSIYTGAHEIISFDTSLGRVEICNRPLHQLASPNGYKLENKVSCTIRFTKNLNFEQANKTTPPLLSIFELILGCKLEIIEYKLHSPSTKEYPEIFDIYQCRESLNNDDEKIPHPAQRLIHVESNQDEFKRVVCNWLIKKDDWQDARWQFFGSFAENKYDTDRLIKVANMFDIIPTSAYGKKNNLPTELEAAKQECRKIFKGLPDSIERGSILGALGRLGTKTLKHKIQIRTDIIKSGASYDFTNIELVISQSVDCRNYFVHGGNQKFDYYDNLDMVCFFISTLEFIYGVSELLESGWDFNNWKYNSPMNHPFYFYLESYQFNINKLKNITN